MTTALTAEADAFAATLGQVLADHAVPDVWRPGTPADDRTPALNGALAAIGWAELVADPEALPFLGPAAVELGCGLAPLNEVDLILGGSPLHQGLARYPAERVVERTREGLREHRVLTATPVAYGDCLAVHTVETEPTGASVEPTAESAWLRAQTGYLAGLAAGALDLAVEHVTQRPAFGTTLSGLEGVQLRLADAAAAAEGLRGLVAQDDCGHAALAYAGRAAETVVSQCHQVVGAIGFTLEFPLHRYSRRARVLAAWNEAWLEGALT
ncbi:acyl-CoA dehydrogenase family protein [Streptomyces sp. NPDC006992]|uniref:acyl-CoA dehydrogenase family protein n=1 Tax=Streptomyces sp. NPDC006992 TaxID=3155601 RepID=UPI0033D6F11E